MATKPSDVQTVAGTKISIADADAVPVTFDAAGYSALTWLRIGEITDGGAHGRTYAEVTHNPIDTRATRKFKGSYNEGTKTLQLGIDRDDVGQVALKNAVKSDKPSAFKVEYQDGDVDYFQAIVLSFEKATAGVDSVVSGTVNLSLTSNSAGVGIIEVPATTV